MLRVGILRAAKWQSQVARIVGGGLKQITRSLRSGLVRRSGLPTNPLLRRHAVRYKRLTVHQHLLRPLRPHIHVRHLHRRNRRHLAAAMSPEPGWDRSLQFGFCLTLHRRKLAFEHKPRRSGTESPIWTSSPCWQRLRCQPRLSPRRLRPRFRPSTFRGRGQLSILPRLTSRKPMRSRCRSPTTMKPACRTTATTSSF